MAQYVFSSSLIIARVIVTLNVLCTLGAHPIELLEHLALLLGLGIHKVINVDSRLVLGRQTKMIDLHLLLLPHAHRPRDGLVHQRRSPPGAHEDNAIILLQVQTHAARLELEEHHSRLSGLLGPCQDLTALLLRERAAVEQDVLVLGQRLVEEELTEQRHLIVELAEDNILMNTIITITTDDLLDLLELGAGGVPVKATVTPVLPPLGVDVDLRMHGDLAQAQKELEGLHRAQLVTRVLGHQALSRALHAEVELLLGLGCEGENYLVDLGHGRRILEQLAKGIEGAMNDNLGQHAQVPRLPAPERRVGHADKGHQ